MDNKQITRNDPAPTEDPYILRIREIYRAMDIILGFTITHIEKAQKAEGDDVDLYLYAIEANIATLFDLLHDGIGYSNMMH